MILTSTAFQDQLNSTSRTVRSKIEKYDTKMAVPTVGVPFVAYEWTDTSTPDWSTYTNITKVLPAATTDIYGVVPNLAVSWAYAAPFFLNIDRYAVQFSGYFYAEETSTDFGFYAFGNNQRIELVFNSVTVISDTSLNGSESSSAISVTSGNWYSYTFRVYGTTGNRDGGIVLKYTHDMSEIDTDDFKASDLKVVNAGVVNITGTYISPSTLSGHNRISGNRSENEPSKYQFELPYGDNGYAKDSSGRYANGSIHLSEGDLIKIYAGYDCDTTPTSTETIGDVSGNVEYIPRFVGNISGFSVDRNSGVLKVSCEDFFSRAQHHMCLNFPDHISYWSAGYMKDTDGNQPNGLIRPVTYDRWNVVSAIEDLLLKAGIPASLFYGKEQRRKSDDDLYDSIDSVFDGGFKLNEADGYGTSDVGEYANKFDVGTTLYDAVMKIVDTYGYLIEFNYAGNLHFFPRNNATTKYSDEGENLSDPTDVNNYVTNGGVVDVNYELLEDHKYLGAGATRSIDTTGVLTFNDVPGTGFTLIFKRDATSGASDNSNEYWSGTASVKIEIRNSASAIVETYNYNLYLEEDWYYTDGTFPTLGANPCVIPLAKDLVYDDYDIIITPQNSSYDITVDELWAYHYNNVDPVKNLTTYLTGGRVGTISSLDFDRSFDDQRNDILVVGQRKGLWVATGDKEVGLSDPEFSENLNNQFTNYHSRNVDIESIFNPAADNYIGQHLMTYIQEPNINTYARARWLSFNVLNKYRNLDNKIDFKLIGDAEIDLQDPVTVEDIHEEDGTRIVWIKSIKEDIRKDGWDVDVGVSGKEPFPSYDLITDYDIGKQNNKYIADLTLLDSFGYSRDGTKTTTTNAENYWVGTTLTVADDVTAWNADVPFVVVVYNTENPLYGVFKVTAASGYTLTGSWLYKVDKSSLVLMYQIPIGWNVANIYNPYEQGDYGNFMILNFTCLVEGKLTSGVKTTNSEVIGFIAGVSNGGGLNEDFLPKEQNVYPGDEVKLIWGGVDERGLTHDVLDQDDANFEIGSGFFAEDGDYYFVFDYERRADGVTIPLSTKRYIDEDGSSQSKLVGMAKSGVDKHLMSYTFDGRETQREVGEYIPGGNGSTLTAQRTGSLNKNYVWVSTDGDIHISFSSYALDVPRSHFINYSVESCTSKGDILTTMISPNVSVNTETVVSQKDWNNGVPVRWASSSGSEYIMRFNPKFTRFGNIDNDSHWASYYIDNLASEIEILVGGHVSQIAYWFRLILDIRDMSGRRIHYFLPSYLFNYEQRIDLMLSRGAADKAMYSEVNYDTVLELYQVPAVLDEEGESIRFQNGYCISPRTPNFEEPGTNVKFCCAILGIGE